MNIKITDDILNGLLATAGKEAKNRINEERRIKNEKVSNFLKKARENSNLLTGDILRELINQHLKIKESITYENKETPIAYYFSFNRVSKILGFCEGKYLEQGEHDRDYYQRRDKNLSDAIKKIDEDVLKILKQEPDKYDGLVMRYSRRDDSLIPTLIDWEFFKNYGIFLKFDGCYKIQDVVVFNCVESLVNKIISGEIDVSKYFSKNEIINFRERMNKITENQVIISQFFKRCDNNLEIVVLDVIKALLNVYREKHKDLNVTEYQVIIPCYLFNKYANEKTNQIYFEKKLGKEEYELNKWMCENSSMNKIFVFQHEKDDKIEYLPVKGEDFTDIIVYHLGLTITNADYENIKVVVDAQSFTNKIIKAVEENEKAIEKKKNSL